MSCSSPSTTSTTGSRRSADIHRRRGANPNLQDKDGKTALHEAARLGRLEICRKLLDAGARVDVTNKHKERPSDLTRRFIREGDFEKHFAPYNVNVTLDHPRYLREQAGVEKLLTATTGLKP
jgi:ankyrin repeat protein